MNTGISTADISSSKTGVQADGTEVRDEVSGNGGRLFLVPTPLGDYPPQDVLPFPVLNLLPSIKLFFVEEIRTARRFLSAAGLKGHIDELAFYQINEHSTQEQIDGYANLLGSCDAALISEAGLPAVADPGARLVELAHNRNIEVVPMSGPSSLMMALMSSGMNGQSFAFNGYLSARREQRREDILRIERVSSQLDQTQIFIETPYRNDSLFEDLLRYCRPSTRICVAADITMPSAFIRTRSVAQWRASAPVIGKRPCVFVLHG